MKLLPGICCLVVLLPQIASSAEQLNGTFGDHMVLQRDSKVPVSGVADAGEKITVLFQSQKKETVADSKGKWSVAQSLDARLAEIFLS